MTLTYRATWGGGKQAGRREDEERRGEKGAEGHVGGTGDRQEIGGFLNAVQLSRNRRIPRGFSRIDRTSRLLERSSAVIKTT